jgi:hypothetical protein
VTRQRGHKRRPEKQDAPVSASYEHGRSIPFDASSRASSLVLPSPGGSRSAQRTKAGARFGPMGRSLPAH